MMKGEAEENCSPHGRQADRRQTDTWMVTGEKKKERYREQWRKGERGGKERDEAEERKKQGKKPEEGRGGERKGE